MERRLLQEVMIKRVCDNILVILFVTVVCDSQDLGHFWKSGQLSPEHSNS